MVSSTPKYVYVNVFFQLVSNYLLKKQCISVKSSVIHRFQLIPGPDFWKAQREDFYLWQRGVHS